MEKKVIVTRMKARREAMNAWRIVKEYALGDKQPFVVSDQIKILDDWFAYEARKLK